MLLDKLDVHYLPMWATLTYEKCKAKLNCFTILGEQ